MSRGASPARGIIMPYFTMIAKLTLLITGLHVGSVSEGVGAYYHEVSLREVCERRVERGWFPPGAELLCGQPCLAAAVTSDPLQLGEYWLVDLPGGSIHVCQIVDVAQKAHEEGLLARGEVIEIDGETARECGWTGYQSGVKVWRLDAQLAE